LLEFRQEELPQINKKFDDVKVEIEIISEEDAKAVNGERYKFEQEYFSRWSQLQELINSRKSNNISGMNMSFGNTSISQRMMLAPISLPTFSGNTEERESFYNSFNAMVHSDEGLTAIQKFYYLCSSVNDAVLGKIRSIPMTDTNYDVSIQRLKKRYDNGSLIIQSHIRSLLDTTKVIEISANQLQKLYSYVCIYVATLKALGQPIQYWDAWLVTIVLSRLDQTTAYERQLRQTDTEMSTFDALDKFISSRCIAFESSKAWAKNKEEAKQAHHASIKENSISGSKKIALTSIEASKYKCSCYGKAHKLYTCQRFQDLEVNDRLSLARENRFCFNYFTPFHTVNACKSKWSCQRCQKKHNSL